MKQVDEKTNNSTVGKHHNNKKYDFNHQKHELITLQQRHL